MELMEAIESRISVRSYDGKEVEAAALAKIKELIDEANQQSELNFQLYGPTSEVAPGVFIESEASVLPLSKQMFAGTVQNYLALVAEDSDAAQELVGYYGEKIVLLAETLGVGTCWVAGTFNRDNTRFSADEGQILHDVIPLGYATAKTPLKQRTIRKGIRARDKKLEELYQGPTALSDAPAWIQAGVLAIHQGPSAINEQPVVIVVEESDEGELMVRTKLLPCKSHLEWTDLGIAKYHFEVAASAHGVQGTWE